MPTMKFCTLCNFMLYPKEDRETDPDKPRLVYYCKSPKCEAPPMTTDDPYVFRNQIVKTRTVNLDVIPPAVAKDPTLMRSREVTCPQCSGNEAVLIQSTQNVKSNRLTLIFVCCNPQCHHKWTDA